MSKILDEDNADITKAKSSPVNKERDTFLSVFFYLLSLAIWDSLTFHKKGWNKKL